MGGCLVEPVCFNHGDCPDNEICVVSTGTCIKKCQNDVQCGDGKICEAATGKCVMPGCVLPSDCANGYECVDYNCRAIDVLVCPEGMAVVDNSFCMDIYEASRPDATYSSWGVDETLATSRMGVIPWQVKDNATAQTACEAANKSLCTAEQWYRSCVGPEKTEYAYGNTYNAATCNGIDTYCTCDDETRMSQPSKSAYPGCYYDCGALFHVEPTGNFKSCKNGYGVYDLNGNLWEHVKGGSDYTIRGGAYNCGNSAKLHQCGYVPETWKPSARGFRCCSAGKLFQDSASDSRTPEQVVP